VTLWAYSNEDEREMIQKLLIANRGEIAVRIIRACKAMGITAVTVYSEADLNSKHVRLADESYCIGAAEATCSYLDGAGIVELARRIGVDAIHPGYGFLAENPEFVALCEAHDIIFVGPNAQVVQSMGSKMQAKCIAQTSDVPTVPGYAGEEQDTAALLLEAERLGMPLMIKASAGGGGRGMRIVHNMENFESQLALAVTEAKMAFGDGRVLLERYIERSRHLEVQVLGDKHGNVVHLFERECSIQRNHQKIIEEAPAAFIDQPTRQKLFDCALQLSREIGYDSAGTVEFILDSSSGEVYFLEMNTRLQVEHPVTELITGIDLVQWQIRIAAGEALDFTQADLAVNGWAIEARVTAEDPGRDYCPETGTLSIYHEPAGDGIRVDSGVEQGSVISPYYDSMIAKTIAYGAHREQARHRLQTALGDYRLSGVGTNIPFLHAILGMPVFRNQPLNTSFLPENFPEGWQSSDLAQQDLLVLAAVAAVEGIAYTEEVQRSPWEDLGGWRLTRNGMDCYQSHLVLVDGTGLSHKLSRRPVEDGCQIMIGERAVKVQSVRYTPAAISADIDGRPLSCLIRVEDSSIALAGCAASGYFSILPQRQALTGDGPAVLSGEGRITAPMPGVVEAVKVVVGERVNSGDLVVVMEAMKLVQNLSSDCAGTVVGIYCEAGQTAEANALLVEIEVAEQD